ncbi:MAG: flagellar hook-associated protein FlgK, partial [Geopsychrobacter sp.]|nr:flagellar hook-associated protein FlgK [Geopsychrobacter sp.]
FGDFFTGTGVTVGSIKRSHDVFLSGQINEKNVASGFENAMTSPLAEIERSIGIGDGSIASEFDQFFDSLRQLSTNPGGEVERQQVLQRGGLIGDTFRNTYDELQQVRGNINNTLVSKIDGINMRTAEIADLNKRISGIEISGQDANSDRDRRDFLVKELSTSIGAKSFETSNGNVSIQLPNGMPLVEADQSTPLEGFVSGVDQQLRLKFGTTNITLDRKSVGGEIGGLYEVRDVQIPGVVDKLDRLAFAFANAVNAQHKLGTGLDGVSGRDFFTPPAAVAGTASSLTMNITTTAEIAAGGTSAPGDNTNSLTLLGLENAQTIGPDTFVSFYGKIASLVGVETARNIQAAQGLGDSLVQLKNLRDGVDGVSLEDEMINLLKYQRGFEASAKFLSTVDEMMGTLLNLKR